MARWTPDDSGPIASSEHIGRRLFDEPKLSGAPDQKPYSGLQIGHFIEKRGSEFSLDRLGKTSIDKRVVRYLMSRCEYAARSFQHEKKFNGWAYCASNRLLKDTSWTIHASGIRARDENGVELPWSDDQIGENRYHAHVLIPDGVEAIRFAYDIREKLIDVQRATNDETGKPKTESSSFGRITSALRAIIHDIASRLKANL